MARTTVEAVRELISTSLEDQVVQGFVNASNLMITELITSSLSEAMLTEIERWLAAHMISMGPSRMTEREKIGDAEVKYAGKFGEGLKATSYGQMVLSLDATGAFAKLGNKTISITAIKSFD